VKVRILFSEHLLPSEAVKASRKDFPEAMKDHPEEIIDFHRDFKMDNVPSVGTLVDVKGNAALRVQLVHYRQSKNRWDVYCEPSVHHPVNAVAFWRDVYYLEHHWGWSSYHEGKEGFG
jgi:hypothetical protein